MIIENKGFTLIEVTITAFLIIVIAAAVVGIQYSIGQNQLVAWQEYLNVDQANSNMANFVREIRNAQPSDAGAYPLVEALDQEIIFYSDIDFDGHVERVRYTLSGSQLMKGVIKPVGFPPTYPLENEKVIVLTENVRNAWEPLFYYYNENWPTDTVNNPLQASIRVSNTKIIKFHLRINTNANDTDRDFILESEAQIRVLKNN